jgi:hypothetical protein
VKLIKAKVGRTGAVHLRRPQSLLTLCRRAVLHDIVGRGEHTCAECTREVEAMRERGVA